MDVDGAVQAQGDDGTAQRQSGFERALEGLRETGASVTIRALVELLARHGSEEGRILAEYERVSTSVPDPAARYLIRLIMDDEHRHHRMLVELATAMAWGTLDAAGSSVPSLGWQPDEELALATRTLREYEEADRRELQELRRQLRPFEETTLWALVVQMMILDTEKHATILKFLERHARRAAPQ
jgi:rubrerythrin